MNSDDPDLDLPLRQRISVDYEALFKEHEDVKKKLDASKARNKYLSTEIKTLKSQISDLLVKSKHDDELVDALLVSPFFFYCSIY